MTNALTIPKFDTDAQEAEFWATLDLDEYFEPSDFTRGRVFPGLKRTKKLISIRLPEQLVVEVKHQAHKHDVPCQRLIQRYIEQGVKADSVEDKVAR